MWTRALESVVLTGFRVVLTATVVVGVVRRFVFPTRRAR